VLARHQGSLRIRSQVGQGSVFTAVLPHERHILLIKEF
jgi:signal transduction histidine kinase